MIFKFFVNWLIFVFCFALTTAFCGIPTWLFLAAKSMLSPVGFWQNLVLFGIGFYFLAGVQFMFFLLWITLAIGEIKFFFFK